MKIKYANNFYLKLVGLMFKKNINYGMYFPSTNMIHTFFMKENIDIIGLNKENVITEIYANIRPNRIIVLKKSINVLELPQNESKKYYIGMSLDNI